MFLSQYRHKLNTRGQVAVPVKMRAEMPVGTVGTHSLYLIKLEDTPIYALTFPVLEELTGRLADQLKADRRSRHEFYSHIEVVEIDPQGRMVIPQWMREAAGIDREIVFAGAGSRIEIWPADKWDEYAAGATEDEKKDLKGLVSETLDAI